MRSPKRRKFAAPPAAAPPPIVFFRRKNRRQLPLPTEAEADAAPPPPSPNTPGSDKPWASRDRFIPYCNPSMYPVHVLQPPNLPAGKPSSSGSTVTSLSEIAPPAPVSDPADTPPIDGDRADPGLARDWKHSDFTVAAGDVVWAKSGELSPAWPAVILARAQRRDVHGGTALYVKFLGSGLENSWVEEAKVFPFLEFLDELQGQKELLNGRAGDLRAAIEQGFLAEHGFLGIVEIDFNRPEAQEAPQEATGSSEDQGFNEEESMVVCCNGVEGKYLVGDHLVVCLCGGPSCGDHKYMIGEWERHTGCRAKKWKHSVRIKSSSVPLGKWWEERNQNGDLLKNNPCTIKYKEQKLHQLLKQPYEPVIVKWTSERCTVCRWVEDWEVNKILICNVCQVAVHQDCYGIPNKSDRDLDRDLASWVCNACESREERECCLCPVRGGPLKPSLTNGLWVHPTCAWFQPQVYIVNDQMRSAGGLTSIPHEYFTKICVICHQMHGACIQCLKCPTSYHAICAARAGYVMELRHFTRNGKEVSDNVSYCDKHHRPDQDNALIIRNPQGVFKSYFSKRDARPADAARDHENKQEDSRSISNNCPGSPSAARCKVYCRNKPGSRNVRDKGVPHRVMGPLWHPLDEMKVLNESYLAKELKSLPTFRERLKYLQRTEKSRLCFGRSAIHGWGLFARRAIQEGDMVIEYRGEVVPSHIADLREARYRLQKKDCYFYKVSDKFVIDATNKGNLARLLNHSCMPNCYARIVTAGRDDNRVVILAKKNLSIGEEITCDYLFDRNEGTTTGRVQCFCRADNCRKFMN